MFKTIRTHLFNNDAFALAALIAGIVLLAGGIHPLIGFGCFAIPISVFVTRCVNAEENGELK